MWHVYLINKAAPDTPIGVGSFESEETDPRKIQILGLQEVFKTYTAAQVQGFGYRIEEHSGKRRKVVGQF